MLFFKDDCIRKPIVTPSHVITKINLNHQSELEGK